MKKSFLILSALMIFLAFNIQAQCEESITNALKSTSIGIVIYSDDAETVWNAIRFANYLP
jgi:hypothetical protein